MASPLSRLVRAGLLTALVDGMFSSVLVVFFYGSTFARLWQGVASVPLGPDQLTGGTAAVLTGLGLHLTTAFTWSAIFIFILMRAAWVRHAVATSVGVLQVAALYGPFIWLVMSCVVIPAFTRRPPTITYRWWVQFVGHIPFVAVPIVAMGRGNTRA